MRDITRKFTTLRTAKAQGRLTYPTEIYQRIQTNDLPKRDPFVFAKAAGMLAAKKTFELIPHCHPIPIEAMDIYFDADASGVTVTAEIKCIGRTGIEMEAMTAVSVALLTIYDLLKPVTKELEILNIKLVSKEGGKSDRWKKVKSGLTTAVLVCSDSISAGQKEDRSGKIIVQMVEEYGVKCIDYTIIPDEIEEIKKYVLDKVQKKVPFVFITGGTGLSPRDQTVEALKQIGEREIPGISEAARVHGYQRTPLAMMSRAISVVIQGTVVVSLPGSTKGVEESLDGILPAVFHADKMLRGERHD